VLFCKDYEEYLAELPPKCGCFACISKWQQTQKERIKRANTRKTSIGESQTTEKEGE